MELRIVRTTARFDAACVFYSELLGWPTIREWDAPQRGRIFGHGDAAVELLEGAGQANVRGLFLSVEVADVDVLHGHLVAAAITIAHPPVDEPWGHRTIGVVDPAGIKVVFFQWI